MCYQSTFKDHGASIYHCLNLPTTIPIEQQLAWHHMKLYMVENVDRLFIGMRWSSEGDMKSHNETLKLTLKL